MHYAEFAEDEVRPFCVRANILTFFADAYLESGTPQCDQRVRDQQVEGYRC